AAGLHASRQSADSQARLESASHAVLPRPEQPQPIIPEAEEGMAEEICELPGTDEPPDADNEQAAQVTAPPQELHCDPFYQKHLSARGLPIISSDKVSDEALHEAAYLVNHVLQERPDIRETMIESGVRFVVMHPSEKTTDFPEQRDLQPKAKWDKLRGLGDLLRNCGEENLLWLPGDK